MKALSNAAWAVLVIVATEPGRASGQEVSGAFTYQGQIKLGSVPVNQETDFEFSLWDAEVGGNSIGLTNAFSSHEVVNGLFMVTLNFGGSAFTGDARWLQIAVRSPAGTGAFTTLAPRQLLTSVPYAIRALQDTGLTLPYAGSANHEAGFAFDVANTGIGGGGITGQSFGDQGFGVFGQVWGNFGIGVHGVAWNETSYAGYFTALHDPNDLVLGGPRGQINSDVGNEESCLYLSSNSDVFVKLDNDGGEAGMFRILNSGGADVCTIDEDGQILAHNDSGLATIALRGNAAGGGSLEMRSSAAITTASVNADYAGGGELILSDSAGTGKVYLRASEAADNAARVLMFNNAGTRTFDLDADRGDGDSGIWMRDNDGTVTVELHSGEGTLGGPTQGGIMIFRTASGAETVRIDAEYGHTTTQILSITGGSDLSEQFDITGQEGSVEPGTVVCIDPRNPGKLVACSRAYDRTVAGVVSGAGGIKPGMLMGQAGSPADGANPVALTGRVFCRADASNGPIAPGDLLTTSRVRGLAMRATDPGRASGAILGKAMSGLPQGQGLVLVLVSLQ